MFLIFGFRRRSGTLAMVRLACRNGHVATHRLVKLTRWFTLFFIPAIPLGRKYLSVCTYCGLQLEIPKVDAEDLVARAAGTSTSAADPVSPPLRSADGAEGTQSIGAPPAGWYPEPAGAPGLRYWDGTAWTEAVEQPES